MRLRFFGAMALATSLALQLIANEIPMAQAIKLDQQHTTEIDKKLNLLSMAQRIHEDNLNDGLQHSVAQIDSEFPSLSSITGAAKKGTNKAIDFLFGSDNKDKNKKKKVKAKIVVKKRPVVVKKKAKVVQKPAAVVPEATKSKFNPMI